MTIKLLATHKQYKPGMIVTLDPALEAFFVAQKNATFDLAGGTPYVEPVVPNQVLSAKLVVNPAGELLGLADTDGKVAGQGVSATVTASFNVAEAHANMLVSVNSASAVNATIQPDSTLNLKVGFNLALVRRGAGAVAFVAGAGVTIRTPSALAARAQYSTISAVKIGANEWLVGGDLT